MQYGSVSTIPFLPATRVSIWQTNIPSVTGCSSGLGAALSTFLATTTNRIVATARDPASLAYLPTSPSILKLSLDVTSSSSIHAAVTETLATFGRIDVLVNNAGYTLVGDAEGANATEARALMDTNFWGVVDVTKEVMGVMRDENPKNGQQGGVIFNVSSMGGWSGFPAGSFYHASKFAVEGWTEAVSSEVPKDWNSKSIFVSCTPTCIHIMTFVLPADNVKSTLPFSNQEVQKQITQLPP